MDEVDSQSVADDEWERELAAPQAGKFGSFATNSLLGRPFYHTYEIPDGDDVSELRIVKASELHAEHLTEAPTSSESRDEAEDAEKAETFDVVGADGKVLIRNNRLTIDDPSRQALTTEEIETLKKGDRNSGKDVIAKIMASHSALDEKTAFSLAKYTLRKSKKYLRRFTALPLDVSMLAQWMLEEKDANRIMDLREETISLITSWANVHYGGLEPELSSLAPSGRWLVADDTGGLVVAALAERMGILHAEPEEDEPAAPPVPEPTGEEKQRLRKPKKYPPDSMSAINNTITVLHPAAQPNISLLSFFSYDPSEPDKNAHPVHATDHPLHAHLKSVSFLQLVDPTLDGNYVEPDTLSAEALQKLKSSQRGNYYRKRRRWETTKRVVDETRAGGFDGLVATSSMSPLSIVHHVVPLLRGGAQVVIYQPNLEPLAELADAYSGPRKTAAIALLDADPDAVLPPDDFPVDPRLLLGPVIHTVRARKWQVLPGRSHPAMTSRGGAEGYVFVATRVIPAGSRVDPRGRFAKRRKTEAAAEQAEQAVQAETAPGETQPPAATNGHAAEAQGNGIVNGDQTVTDPVDPSSVEVAGVA